jgi:ketosteroid isomerase-like protein
MVSRHNSLTLIAVGFLAAAAVPAAGAEACRTVTSGKAVDEIRALEEAGGQSNVIGMTLEDGKRMFAASFMSFGPDGAVKTRDDILKTYVDGQMAAWASSFAIKELQIKVYCDTATVIGLSDVAAKNAAPDAPPVHFRWLNVWAKPEGFWQIVATQFTRLK